MRDYYRRQAMHRRQMEERVREVREKLPRIKEIDHYDRHCIRTP